MRSPRLPREAVIDAEVQQAQVVAELTLLGEDDLAHRLARCQQARLWRNGGWLWRCRLAAGCFSCRRGTMRGWWQGITEWARPEATLLSIPLGEDVLDGVRRVRRGLRDVRDRAAHRYGAWREVAFGGIASGATAMVWAAHPNIPQASLLAVLRQRWSDTAVLSAMGNEPSWQMDTDTAVRLSVLRRGMEPLRVVVMPQDGREHTMPLEPAFLEPMPILL